MAPAHVLDLPNLHSCPDYETLQTVLNSLAVKPAKNFQATDHPAQLPGLVSWLTTMVGSPLHWLSDSERNGIWDLASLRLAERCGRTAAPTQTREFEFDTVQGMPIEVQIVEPALTSDNLGLKTWGSAYVLAKRLALQHDQIFPQDTSTILELGSGTGLVGIASAKLGYKLCLTDLPEIVGNLRVNVENNAVAAEVAVLDWSDPAQFECLSNAKDTFNCIIVADPIYSPAHPSMVCKVIERYLTQSSDARLCVQLPLREKYGQERLHFYQLLSELGLKRVRYEEQTDDDDFGVTSFAWSLWQWSVS